MRAPSYTPGPWHINRDSGAITAQKRTQAGKVSPIHRTLVGIVRLQSNGCEQGNALLIGLAPEMLELLKEVLRVVESKAVDHEHPVISKARAIVTRAEKRS